MDFNIPHHKVMETLELIKGTEAFESKYIELLPDPESEENEGSSHQINVKYIRKPTVEDRKLSYQFIILSNNDLNMNAMIPIIFDDKDYMLELLSLKMDQMREELLLHQRHKIRIDKETKANKSEHA